MPLHDHTDAASEPALLDDGVPVDPGRRFLAPLLVALRIERGRTDGADSFYFARPDEIDALRLAGALLHPARRCPVTGADLGMDLSRADAEAERLSIAMTPVLMAELRAMDFMFSAAFGKKS